MRAVDRPAVTVLDCTLRDGGYYNDWAFDDVLVESYLAACAEVGVDVVELGYAGPGDAGRGPYGRLPDGFPPHLAAALSGDRGTRLAVMVDAGPLLGDRAAEAGSRLAERLATGPLPIDLVRIAVNHARTAETGALVEAVRSAGFGVCLNLMQIDLADGDRLARAVDAVAGMAPLEAVYIADSLGSMSAERIAALVERFRAGQDAPVGIHAHDNQGFALHNTLAAADAGATWLDATVLGMGRGAGNTRTEQLLAALGTPPDRLRPLLETAARRFTTLLDKYRWGANPLYALAGMDRVHPSYVQCLEQTTEHSLDVKLRVLRSLAAVGANAFSAGRLETALRDG
ncbi:hypothetical protein ACFSJS_11170 [Streptomyces desertarenae]|uniref:Pyruvate carboxyltransferase domain-containing protein n=1 Tax=Streptomyces desertarenae TaxID=2666184 RepID=A0ABW4PLA9_9ACTN